jgi:hypothetical protein
VPRPLRGPPDSSVEAIPVIQGVPLTWSAEGYGHRRALWCKTLKQYLARRHFWETLGSDLLLGAIAGWVLASDASPIACGHNQLMSPRCS